MRIETRRVSGIGFVASVQTPEYPPARHYMPVYRYSPATGRLEVG